MFNIYFYIYKLYNNIELCMIMTKKMFRFIIIFAIILSLVTISYNNNNGNVYQKNRLLCIFQKETILPRKGGVKKSSLHNEMALSYSSISDTMKQDDMCNSDLLYPTYGHSKHCFSHL